VDERTLPNAVVVLEGTDVNSAWDRFEVFEALHHNMQICNPMMGEDLDRVLAGLSPRDGDHVLDIACGHGELLIRAAARVAIHGVGVDLSPWAVVRACENAGATASRGEIEWWLGDAHELPGDEAYDVVSCLGASWIWHGFEGTAGAMVTRSRRGGRLAIGDLRLRAGVDGDAISRSYGRVMTETEQRAVLDRLGVDVTDRIDAEQAGWDGYQRRIADSAHSWAALHPGPDAERYLREQAQWREEHERDRRFLDWTVWTGTIR